LNSFPQFIWSLLLHIHDLLVLATKFFSNFAGKPIINLAINPYGFDSAKTGSYYRTVSKETEFIVVLVRTISIIAKSQNFS
jgi:hypothetical protein